MKALFGSMENLAADERIGFFRSLSNIHKLKVY